MKIILKNIVKLILYFGIFAFLAGLVLLTYWGQYENFQQPLYRYLILFPPIIIIGITLVFASIFEELVFRGWILKNRVGKIISYIGIIIYVHLTFNSYLLSSLVSAAIFVIYFIIKNDKWKLALSIIITSILFGIVHFYNYSDTFTRLFSIIQLIGLSFIISYVGLRFGFWYCTLVHFINNLIAMLILFIFINVNYSGNFENNSYRAKLAKTPFTDFSFKNYTLISYDTISINAHITQIAESIADHERKTIFKSNISNLIKYKFTVVAKNDTINQNQLFQDIVKHANLKLDTTYEQAYIMSISDTAKLYNIKESENTYPVSMHFLMGSIRDIYKIPIIIENEENKSMFNIDYRVLQIKNEEEFIKRLKDEYGINIEKSNHEKAIIITIKEAV